MECHLKATAIFQSLYSHTFDFIPFVSTNSVWKNWKIFPFEENEKLDFLFHSQDILSKYLDDNRGQNPMDLLWKVIKIQTMKKIEEKQLNTQISITFPKLLETSLESRSVQN